MTVLFREREKAFRREPGLRTIPGNCRGVALIGLVGLLLFLGLFLAVGTSMVSSSVGSHNNKILGAQALGIAHGGADWYLEQLKTDTDWSNEIDQNRSFAEGEFRIQILGLLPSSATKVLSFRSGGEILSSFSGVTVRRTVNWTAWKLSPAFQFALYQGSDPGADWVLTNQGNESTKIKGDVWSFGSVRVDSPNRQQGGKVFVPDTRDVTGTGEYQKKKIPSPYLSMPVLTKTYYENLMVSFDALLNANNSTEDRVVDGGIFDLNSDPACIGGICNFRNFSTKGTVTIQGNGTIVASDSILLHTDPGFGLGSLTVNPDAGGRIAFAANKNLLIGWDPNPLVINIQTPCTFYSRSLLDNTGHIGVTGNQTKLHSSLLLARRRIVVEKGADILDDGILFVDDAGADLSNNHLEILGDIGITSVDGSLLSLSRKAPGLILTTSSGSQNDFLVQGLIYAYGGGSSGTCEIRSATIKGSVVCNRFLNNEIINADVGYHPSYLPAIPPDGWENYVMKKPDSYDGL